MSLSEEDRTWIGGLFFSLDAKIESGLVASDAKIESRMKQLKSDSDRLRVDLAELRSEVKADVERVETSLLREFHKWASPAELRMRSHSAAIRLLDVEIEAVSDRVHKLEHPTP